MIFILNDMPFTRLLLHEPGHLPRLIMNCGVASGQNAILDLIAGFRRQSKQACAFKMFRKRSTDGIHLPVIARSSKNVHQ